VVATVDVGPYHFLSMFVVDITPKTCTSR
jgi:hypothetical protein